MVLAPALDSVLWHRAVSNVILSFHAPTRIMYTMIDGYLTTKQASERYRISAGHLRHLLEDATIRGVKVGRDWLVESTSLEDYLAHRPRPGRKPKREPMRESQ